MSENNTEKIRNEYINSKNQQTDQFDKHMLLLSSGTFGVTFSFIEKFTNGIFINSFFLLFGWGLFALSILSTLMSFLISQIAYKKAIDELDKMIVDSNYQYKEPFENFVISVLNWYSMTFFILGVFSIMVFIFFNI